MTELWCSFWVVGLLLEEDFPIFIILGPFWEIEYIEGIYYILVLGKQLSMDHFRDFSWELSKD